MTATVIEQNFKTALANYPLPGGPYNSAQLGLGTAMVQSNGGGNTNSFIGPHPIGLARPMEQSVAIPSIMPFAFQWDTVNNIYWVFLADNAAAAATRRINLYTFNQMTGTFTWIGFITLTFPTSTVHTIRGLRAAYRTESTGTVAVAGTAVTGTSTKFSTNRLCVGSRIGFGSTDPTQITTWYYISAIGSDTGLTLSTSAGTIAGGTSYVVEDLMVLTATTNATLTNGGLFVTKGISFADFTTIGTTIPAGVSTDLIKAVYWLKDASTETNTIAMGMGLEAYVDPSDQFIWVANLSSATTVALYKYNFRKALTLSSGADTTAFVFATGVITITGTAQQVNNGRVFTMQSGPGSGIACYYFTTSTRVYRSIQTSTITTGSVAWGADTMTEIPPGGINTFAAQSNWGNMDYADSIDKLIICNTAAAARPYVSAYNSSGLQLDRIMWSDTRQLDQSLADSSITPYPNTINWWTVYATGGTMFVASITGITASSNFLYAFPIGGDWEYQSYSNTGIILPAMTTPNCDTFSRVYVNDLQVLGGDTGHNLGVSMMGYKVYYRTAGISDNSGSWTLVDYSGDLSSVAGASQIQFMLQFRTIGEIAAPSRVLVVGVVYNDFSTDSHYQPSVNNSSPSTSKFAWRFATAFGTTVPALRVRLYNAVTSSLLVDDNTTSPTGTFEQSTDGGTTWTSWTDTDLTNTTTYIRYTPASLASGINVLSLLTLD